MEPKLDHDTFVAMLDAGTHPSQRPVDVTMLDIETGETVEVAEGITVWSWSEGNWACDSNRQDYFGHDNTEYLDEERIACIGLGQRRYLVVACSVGVPDDYNRGYPPELRAKAASWARPV